MMIRPVDNPISRIITRKQIDEIYAAESKYMGLQCSPDIGDLEKSFDVLNDLAVLGNKYNLNTFELEAMSSFGFYLARKKFNSKFVNTFIVEDILDHKGICYGKDI